SILPSRTADNLAQMIEPGLDHYFGVPSAKQPGIIRILAAALERISPPRLSFVHRDFHVENLIWLSERRGVARAGLIDFQDAFLGDPIYDLASLVTDARRDVGEALRDRMIRDYANETEQSHDAVADRVALFGIQRNLRILGIFTWLGAVPHKSRYLALVPRVRAYLDRDLMHPAAREVRTALTPYLELKATAARGAES
ncbi:MAG: phosphotransferase, partial [Pseudomonadota bacterium]